MSDTTEIDNEFDAKAVVIRDGARGWRLSATYIEDALDLLKADDQLRNEYEVPSEDDEDYLETVSSDATELEHKLDSAGYTTVWNDGYVIYHNLSEAAQEALQDV